MKDWQWIDEDIALILHQMSIKNYGRADGVRDIGLLQSALARPKNIVADGASDIFLLAAAYGFGIVRNHPFIDGNKRTAFLCCLSFLRVHGVKFKASQAEAAAAFLELAAGNLSEEGLAHWLREKSE